MTNPTSQDGMSVEEVRPAARDTSGWQMRETTHINGGKEWFGYKYQCIQEPRISRMDRYIRKDRSVKSTWRIDGEDRASFEEAVADLGYPPTLTVSELGTLAQFCKPAMSKGDFQPDFSTRYPDLRSLADKGLVWWEDGKARAMWDRILPAADRVESNASGTPEWDSVGPAIAALRSRASSALSREVGKGVGRG